MKKLGVLVPMTACLIALVATPAFAGSEVIRGDNIVKGEVVVPPGGLSYTGASVTLWMVLAAAFLVGGMALLIVGRVRRAGAAE